MAETVRFGRIRAAIAGGNVGRVLTAQREAAQAERVTLDRRTAAFDHYFNKQPNRGSNGEVEFFGKDQYLFNSSPIIRPDNPSPLVAMLLDGLAQIVVDRDDGRLFHNVHHPVVLNGIAAMRKTARLSDTAHGSLHTAHVEPETSISHRREHSDWFVPAELDEWFIGIAQGSNEYGSNLPILLQPHEVVMTGQQPPRPEA
jgi:hypothetical protein